MPLVVPLPPEQEAQFEAWAAQQGEAVQRDARALYSEVAERSWWEPPMTLLVKALTLTRPVLDEAAKQRLGGAQYLLILLETMTALYHAHGGRPLTPAELAKRTPLQDAMTLYDLGVVSLGIAARIAHVSVSEFIDALGEAGISVFQYSAEEALADLAELEGVLSPSRADSEARDSGERESSRRASAVSDETAASGQTGR